MRDDVADWLIGWFTEKGLDPAQDRSELLATDFFATGLIDSLGVIGLISEIEAHFGLRFADTDFQDRRFPTIGGLATIVSGRTGDHA